MENNELMKEKRRSLKKTILIIIGIVIVLLIALGVNYLKSLSNPRTLFKNVCDTIFSETLNTLENLPNLNDMNEGTIKFNTNIEDYSFLNSEVIDYTFGLDVSQKRLISSIKLTEDNKEIFNIEGNAYNNNVYINLNDLFSKNILIDDDTIKDNLGISINDIFEEINDVYNEEYINDYKYIVNSFKNLTNTVIDKINYSKEKETLNINEDNVKVNKIIINFDKENIDLIINTYVDGILNDNELIKRLVKLLDIEKEELIDNLNELKDYDDSDIDESSKLVVYTKGILNEFVKVELVEDAEELISYVTYNDYKLLRYNDIEIEINNQKLVIKNDNEIIIKGSVNSLEKENVDISFEVLNSNTKGNIVYQKKNEDIKLKINLENTEENNKITIDIDIKETGDKEYKINANVSTSFEDKTFNVTLENRNGIKGLVLEMPDTSNSINYKNITEEDIETIMDNLEKRLENTKIMDIINTNNSINVKETI